MVIDLMLIKLTHKLLGLISIDLLKDTLLRVAVIHILVITKTTAAHTLFGTLSLGRAHFEVNHGRDKETKALGHRLQVKCVNIEYLFQLMRVISANI